MLQKLASRKFLVSLGAIASALLGADLPTSSIGVIGVVAVAYLIIEGLIDRARAEQLAKDIQTGIELGRRASEGGEAS